MANSIKQMMSQMGGNAPMRNGGNNPLQMMQQFRQFANGFRGDPKQQVMNMMQQGQISQQQLDQLMNQAHQMMPMFRNMMGGFKR